MFRLEKEFRFEASHQLPLHEGKCKRLHGHSWKARIVVEGKELQKEGSETGMLMDYARLNEAIGYLIERYLDHWHLNQTTGLDNPTSEELARWIYNRLKPRLPALTEVQVDETCTTKCIYRPLP